MSAPGFSHRGERTLHAGHMLELVTATVEVPDGTLVEREIIRHPGAVAISTLR